MNRGSRTAIIIFLVALIILFAIAALGYFTGGWEVPT